MCASSWLLFCRIVRQFSGWLELRQGLIPANRTYPALRYSVLRSLSFFSLRNHHSMSLMATESLSGQIARHLANRIIQGELAPGERIQEGRVVNELNVSRGSVREALLLLEKRLLMRILPRWGAVVAQLSAQHVNSVYDLYVKLKIMLAQEVAQHCIEQSIPPLTEQVQRIQRVRTGQEKAA